MLGLHLRSAPKAFYRGDIYLEGFIQAFPHFLMTTHASYQPSVLQVTPSVTGIPTWWFLDRKQDEFLLWFLAMVLLASWFTLTFYLPDICTTSLAALVLSGCDTMGTIRSLETLVVDVKF